MRPLAADPAARFRRHLDPTAGPVPPGTAGRIIGLARPRRRTIALFGMVAVLGGMTAMLTPFALRTLVDDGVVSGRSDVVLRMALAAAELAAADALLSLVRRWLAARAGEDLALDLRSRAYVHVQQQALGSFGADVESPGSPRRWRLLNDDVSRVEEGVTDLLAAVTGSAVIAAFVLAAMAVICWPLALAVLVVLALARRPARAAARRSVTRRAERAAAVADLDDAAAERFAPAGAVLAVLYGDPEQDADAFDVRAAQLRDLGVRVALGDGAEAVVLPLLTGIATAVVFGAGGLLVLSGHLALGGMVAVAACVARLHRAVATVARAPSDAATVLAAGSRLFGVLDLAPPIRERTGALTMWRGPTAVAFEHVDVARPPDAPLPGVPGPSRPLGPMLLRDIDLRVGPGELVAVVGPGGTGTRAVSALVPRLLDVTAGAVRLGGVDVRDVTLESLRAKVGVVPAEAHVLRETLAVNLRLARPSAEDGDLLDALAEVDLADLVPALPQGLDTLLAASDEGTAGAGPAARGRGHVLSAGERQRLALARILLQAPDVVVVDEPAAPLDPIAERAGQRALAAVLNGRTAIVVAHRLATLRRADRIVVIDEGGRIVEQGTHLELLANDRAYTQLYHLELADHEDDTAARQAVLS